jgi:hypothetical protein
MPRVLRADLIEAGHGELMDELRLVADTLTPAQRRRALDILSA